ncbi:MAG: hypothetical protein WED15_06890 [Akkermansiaceae bacterium]
MGSRLADVSVIQKADQRVVFLRGIGVADKGSSSHRFRLTGGKRSDNRKGGDSHSENLRKGPKEGLLVFKSTKLIPRPLSALGHVAKFDVAFEEGKIPFPP